MEQQNFKTSKGKNLTSMFTKKKEENIAKNVITRTDLPYDCVLFNQVH